MYTKVHTLPPQFVVCFTKLTLVTSFKNREGEVKWLVYLLPHSKPCPMNKVVQRNKLNAGIRN